MRRRWSRQLQTEWIFSREGAQCHETSAAPRVMRSRRLRRRLSRVILTAADCAGVATRSAEATPIEVWTGPSWSCCHDWIKHLRRTAPSSWPTTAETATHARVSVSSLTTSRATRRAVAGYAIEGHVPAREIRRRLDEANRCDLLCVVPAMPCGSPGMDDARDDGARDPYTYLYSPDDGTA